MQDSAVARDKPRPRARSSTISSTGRSSSTKTAAPRAPRRSVASALRVAEQLDPDLARVRADRGLDSLGLSPGLRERARHRRLAQPVHAQDAPLRSLRPLEDTAHGLVLERRSPQPSKLRRRPGQDDSHGAARFHDEARSRAGDPDHPPPLGHRRLLAHALLELGVRPPEPLRDPPRDALDLRGQLLHHPDLQPRRPRQQLDGPVVVRRPEPSREHEQIRLQRLRGCAASRSDGSSPTIVIRAGSRPSRVSSSARKGPFESRRPPRISSLPVTRTVDRGDVKPAVRA